MMYLCFREKGWTPGQYYWMSPSEKIITSAFMRKMLEDRQKELEEIEKNVR